MGKPLSGERTCDADQVWEKIMKMIRRIMLALALSAFAMAAVQANPNKLYGAHDYQLMIIGQDDTDGKLGNDGQDNGKRIFVRLHGKTKILLSEGDFDVVDADGTDGTARFQLPNPDPEGDGTSAYRVMVRALGTPGGWAALTTCVEDADLVLEGDQVYCPTSSTVITRDSKKPRWENVTRDLLYLEIDIDGDGRIELVPLFDDSLEGYYWDYDGNGLRVAQMRFYGVVMDICTEAGGVVDDSGYCELPLPE